MQTGGYSYIEDDISQFKKKSQTLNVEMGCGLELVKEKGFDSHTFSMSHFNGSHVLLFLRMSDLSSR